MHTIYCLNKKLSFLLLMVIVVISSFFFFAHTVHADSLFGLTLTYDTPGLFKNQIPLNLNINSSTDISEVKVQWIVPFGLNTTTGETTSYTTSLIAGNVLYDHLVVSPLAAGIYEVSVTVSGISNAIPFTKTISIPLTIDSNLHLTDASASYNIRKSIYFVIAGVCFVFFVFLMKGVYNSSRNKFFSWLNKES